MVVLGLTQIDHKYIIPFNSPLDNTSTDNSINHCVHPYISTRVTNYYSLSLSLSSIGFAGLPIYFTSSYL